MCINKILLFAYVKSSYIFHVKFMIQTRVENQPAKNYCIHLCVCVCVRWRNVAVFAPLPKRNCIHLHVRKVLWKRNFHQFIGETQKAIKIQIEALRRSCEAKQSAESFLLLRLVNVLHATTPYTVWHTVIFLNSHHNIFAHSLTPFKMISIFSRGKCT